MKAGVGYRCAMLVEGGVSCWGDNRGGTIGNDVSLSILSPAKLTLASPATGLASGIELNTALLQDGTMVAWGANFAFGSGTDIAPVPTNVTTTGFMSMAGHPYVDFGAYVSQTDGFKFVLGNALGAAGHLVGQAGLTRAYPGILRHVGATSTSRDPRLQHRIRRETSTGRTEVERSKR